MVCAARKRDNGRNNDDSRKREENMTPINFPEANCKFSPPSDLEESQCMTIYAHRGEARGGSVDGSQLVIVAWKPDAAEMADIVAGKPIFLSVMGGLPPHFLTTDFKQANRPA